MEIKKKILFVATVYRVGERIYSAIPELAKLYDIDLLLINEMSKKMPWYGDIDPCVQFMREYQKYFRYIYDAGFESSKQAPGKLLYTLSLDDYSLVLVDDDRNRYGTAVLYNRIKGKFPVVGCIHGAGIGYGNKRFLDCHKIVWDYLFVFGEKDLKVNNYHKDVFAIGIPSNDILKNYELTDKNILVIINCLANRWSPVQVNVDKEFIKKSGIVELQKEFNKEIIFKIKSRHVHQHPEKDIEYLHSILDSNIKYRIIMDDPDNNQLIADAFIVISGASTLAFKSIQFGIPTVCIKGSGIETGHFEDYKGLIELDTQKIYDELERQYNWGKEKKFITDTIEGGLEFNSTEYFMKSIKQII